MFGVRGHSMQRLRGGLKENVVDRSPVVICDARDLFRQRKYDVEIFDRQQLLPACLDPFGPRHAPADHWRSTTVRLILAKTDLASSPLVSNGDCGTS